ncbi:MAG: radical SAM family heme chaperone HemW [Planctomycetes bacterium]|nr:radical SAM family heme chaperone HemW [Planctomycetota bacterium]
MHLYLHIPYCVSKCPYCDFNSHAGREHEFAAYIEALLTEVRRLPPGPYDTLFIGGGTPTVLPPALLAQLLAGLRAHLQLSPGYEWTCEANPGSSDAERFAVLADYGVNRLSLGVQSFHDRHLRFLGRAHDAAGAQAALASAQRRFAHLNVDLMYGLPGQSVEEALADARTALAFGVGHLAAYHLAIEPGTEFHARQRRGQLPELDPERSRELMRCLAEFLTAQGLPPYETSNYARPGEACRHNLAYWRQRDWQAAGAGAVSCVQGQRWTRLRQPAAYIAAIRRGADAIGHRERIDARTRLREAWMLGLRLTEGVARARLRALGDDEQRWLPIARSLAEVGLIELDAERVRLAPQARYAQDEVTVRLLP